jgi:hypothetical protein
MLLVIISTNVEKGFKSLKFKTLKVEKPLKSNDYAAVKPLWGCGKKERGPEPRPLLQATILFHLRGHLINS